MQQVYRTEHSNHVHQLVVAVSRHFYVTSAGKFKKQVKPFEAKLDRPESFTKRHIVHYMIRDHFSGLFYAEVTDTEHLYPVTDFLCRAWSPKETHCLRGVPLAMTVPKNVHAVWPEISTLLTAVEVESIEVTSGFQGGIRDIRTWEEHLRCGLYTSGFPPDISEVLSQAPDECARVQRYDYRGEKSKAMKWQEGLSEEVYIPEALEMISCGKKSPSALPKWGG